MIRYIFVVFFMAASFSSQAEQTCEYSYDEFIKQATTVFNAFGQDMQIVDEMPHGETRKGVVYYRRPLPYLMEFYFDWGQDGQNDGIFFIGASLHDKSFFTIGSSEPQRFFSEQLFGCYNGETKQLIFQNDENDLKAVLEFSIDSVVSLRSYYREKNEAQWLRSSGVQKFIIEN